MEAEPEQHVADSTRAHADGDRTSSVETTEGASSHDSINGYSTTWAVPQVPAQPTGGHCSSCGTAYTTGRFCASCGALLPTNETGSGVAGDAAASRPRTRGFLRNPGLLAGLSALVFLLLAGGAFLLLSSPGKPAHSSTAASSTNDTPVESSTPTDTVTTPSDMVTTPSDTVTTPPAPVVLSVGMVVPITNSDGLDGSITVKSMSFYTSAPGDFYTVRPAGKYFLLVKVEFKSNTGDWDINPYDWRVQGPDGSAFQPAEGNAIEAETNMNVDMFDSITLHDGQKRAGYMMFDIDSRHGQLQYIPGKDIVATWGF